MVDERVDVTVALEDALSRPAGRAEDSIEDLRQEVERLNATMAENAAAQKRQERAMAALRREAERSRHELESNRKAQARQREEAGRGAKALAVLRGELDKSRKGVFGLGTAFKLLKIQSVISLLTLAAAAVSALGAATIAGVAGLSPLVGVFAALPGVIFAAVSAFGAAKVATMGLGDALKALNDPAADPEKIAAAMNKLTGEGRYLAVQLTALAKGPLARLRRDTQSALAPGLSDGLRDLNPLLPVANRRLRDTALTLADLARSAGDAARTGWFRGQVARIMRSNNVVLENGGKAGGYLGLALLDVADAARPMTEDMSRSAESVARYLSEATEAGRESGRLTAFLMDAWTMARQVGGVFSDLAVILFNVGRQSDAVSGAMGEGIISRLAQLRDYTSSITGQREIGDWFERSLPVLSSFARLLGSVTFGLGNLSQMAELSPVIDQINEELVPAFKDTGSTISTEIAPALVDAATAAVNFLDVISNSPVPDVLSVLAKGVLGISQALDMLPGPAKYAIALVLALGFAIRTMGALSALAGIAMAPVQTAIRTTGAFAVTSALQIGGLRGAMAGLRIAGSGVLGMLGGPFGVAILAATAGVGLFMRSQQKSKEAVDNLKSSLDEQTGALTENTRVTAAKALADQGALKDARMAGASLEDVTSAALGNTAAYERVVDQIKAHRDAQIADTKAGGDAYKTSNEEEAARQRLLKAIGGQNDALNEAVQARRDENAAIGEGTQSMEGYATSANAAEGALNAQADAANRTRAAIKALNDEMVGNERSLIGFRQNVHDAAKQLRENFGKGLDITTEAGRKNRTALLDVAEAASQVKDEAQRTKAIKEATRFIRDWGEKAGWSDERAKNYAKRLFALGETARGLPREAGVDVSVTGSAAAADALALVKNQAIDLRQRLDALRTVSPNQVGNAALADQAATAPATPAPTTTGTGRNGRRRLEGGPVWTGEPFRVGEAGPELLLTNAGLSVIGAAGEQTRTFDRPGMVLPNEVYREVAKEPPASWGAQPPAPPPATGGGVDAGDLAAVLAQAGDIQVHNHFHGDVGAKITLDDIGRATRKAIADAERDKKERG